MTKLNFTTDCINANGDDINDMIEKAREITYRTFFKYVDLKNVSEMLGYSLHPKQGLTIKNDLHVTYAKSFYKSVPCYYVSWSAIEYIFT